MTTPTPIPSTPEQRAITLYQRIMRVNWDSAEHSYMLIEPFIASADERWPVQFSSPEEWLEHLGRNPYARLPQGSLPFEEDRL
jgi:hypothetical protein